MEKIRIIISIYTQLVCTQLICNLIRIGLGKLGWGPTFLKYFTIIIALGLVILYVLGWKVEYLKKFRFYDMLDWLIWLPISILSMLVSKLTSIVLSKLRLDGLTINYIEDIENNVFFVLQKLILFVLIFVVIRKWDIFLLHFI